MRRLARRGGRAVGRLCRPAAAALQLCCGPTMPCHAFTACTCPASNLPNPSLPTPPSTAVPGNPYFRLAFNSLGAYGTINHLHYQVGGCAGDAGLPPLPARVHPTPRTDPDLSPRSALPAAPHRHTTWPPPLPWSARPPSRCPGPGPTRAPRAARHARRGAAPAPLCAWSSCASTRSAPWCLRRATRCARCVPAVMGARTFLAARPGCPPRGWGLDLSPSLAQPLADPAPHPCPHPPHAGG